MNNGEKNKTKKNKRRKKKVLKKTKQKNIFKIQCQSTREALNEVISSIPNTEKIFQNIFKYNLFTITPI